MSIKGTGHFFKTLSEDSVHGTDHSFTLLKLKTRFQAEKCIYIYVLASAFSIRDSMLTRVQL